MGANRMRRHASTSRALGPLQRPDQRRIREEDPRRKVARRRRVIHHPAEEVNPDDLGLRLLRCRSLLGTPVEDYLRHM